MSSTRTRIAELERRLLARRRQTPPEPEPWSEGEAMAHFVGVLHAFVEANVTDIFISETPCCGWSVEDRLAWLVLRDAADLDADDLYAPLQAVLRLFPSAPPAARR